MDAPQTFVVVTHPAQLQQQHLKRRVRSFTSKHNRRQERVKANRPPRGPKGPKFVPIPTDEEQPEGKQIVRQEHTKSHPRLPPVKLYNSNESRKRTPLNLDQTLSNMGNMQIELLEPYRAHHGTGEHVSRLLDYYIQVYGPTYIWRPEMISVGSVENFSRWFFQATMSQSMLLECILMLCQAQLELRALPESQPSKIVMVHRTRTLNALQQKLTSGSNDDSVLIAVLGALTYDLIYSDWTSFEANLKGLRNLVHLRGGLSDLGGQGWFEYVTNWAELRWANHLAQLPQTERGHQPPVTLTYPRHPFSSDTCLLISKLPIGFQDTTLTSLLSIQTLDFMLAVSKWSENFTRAVVESCIADQGKFSLEGIQLAARVSRLLACPQLHGKERLLCTALLAFVVSFDGSQATQARYPRGLENHMRELGKWTAGITERGCACLVWIALVLASAKDSMAAPLANRWTLLDKVVDEGDFRTWEEVRLVARTFFWNQWLEARWEGCWRNAHERKVVRDMERKSSERFLPIR